MKHADGVRGPTQAASTIETEVTSGEDPCEKFGAERHPGADSCLCPEELPLPRKCEGTSGSTFNLKETIEAGSGDCRCETETSGNKDPCEKFGAERAPFGADWCLCPEELPLPRKCEGTYGRTFDLKETIEAGFSDCRCVQDPCEKFGAKRNVDDEEEDFCLCPKDRFHPTKECGASWGSFYPSRATPGCRCLTMAELTQGLRVPVAASALQFCSALVEHSYSESEEDNAIGFMGYTVSKTSPEICQHALVGTINKTEAKGAPWAEEASELSHKGSDDGEDADQDGAYGRMRAVKKDVTKPEEKALWEHALAQVCKDECEDLLKMMKKEARHLAEDVEEKHIPFAQTCAERVVKHVEAEVLGCCARSCGFDGHTCLLWPFFSPEEKVDWQLECCAEISILKHSSRELMCNSVLSGHLAKEASKYDLEEEDGTDVGKVLIGQNSSLVWTREGIKFHFPKKSKEDEEEAESTPREGDKVSIDFLLKHQKVGEEFLRLGYFREEPITKILNEATSVMQVSSQDDTCNFGKFEQQCPQKFMTTFVKKCNEAWSVTQESEDFENLLTHPEEGHCDEPDSENFATPEDCQKLAKHSGEIFLHYFTYNKENKDLPIKCFSVSKEQCTGPGKDDWWKRIPLVSVQKLMNQDVNDYTQLVYIKVKTN